MVKRILLGIFLVNTMILFNLPSITLAFATLNGEMLFNAQIYSNGLALFSVNIFCALLYLRSHKNDSKH